MNWTVKYKWLEKEPEQMIVLDVPSLEIAIAEAKLSLDLAKTPYAIIGARRIKHRNHNLKLIKTPQPALTNKSSTLETERNLPVEDEQSRNALADVREKMAAMTKNAQPAMLQGKPSAVVLRFRLNTAGPFKPHESAGQ